MNGCKAKNKRQRKNITCRKDGAGGTFECIGTFKNNEKIVFPNRYENVHKTFSNSVSNRYGFAFSLFCFVFCICQYPRRSQAVIIIVRVQMPKSFCQCNPSVRARRGRRKGLAVATTFTLLARLAFALLLSDTPGNRVLHYYYTSTTIQCLVIHIFFPFPFFQISFLFFERSVLQRVSFLFFSLFALPMMARNIYFRDFTK